jgi:hypothetical protein
LHGKKRLLGDCQSGFDAAKASRSGLNIQQKGPGKGDRTEGKAIPIIVKGGSMIKLMALLFFRGTGCAGGT